MPAVLLINTQHFTRPLCIVCVKFRYNVKFKMHLTNMRLCVFSVLFMFVVHISHFIVQPGDDCVFQFDPKFPVYSLLFSLFLHCDLHLCSFIASYSTPKGLKRFSSVSTTHSNPMAVKAAQFFSASISSYVGPL